VRGGAPPAVVGRDVAGTPLALSDGGMGPEPLEGLTTAAAARVRATAGRNLLPSGARRSRGQLVLAVVREPMLGLLAAAAVIYLAFGDRVEAAGLAISVVAVIALTTVQHWRSERAIAALRELATPRTRVRRDGRWIELDARDLVPGDAIAIAEGERVPADALLRGGSAITVDESALTGESVAAIRTPDPDATSIGAPGDTPAAIYAGTLVRAGSGVAEVVVTGARTAVGRIGEALQQIELGAGPLQREVGVMVRRIAAVAIALCVIVAVVHLAAGRAWLDAALAGITLAIALLPEELPLVLTVFFTLGAWRIARHRVLARRAAAIETLGAVTVLCVDKTGTLTRNRMELRRIEPADGRDVQAVIELGALASPARSTEPMDQAFQARASASGIAPGRRWLREYPLEPGLLAVTHVWREPGADHVVVASKGAPEAILELCRLAPADAARWRERVDAMARAGLRVLGVARATHGGGALADDVRAYDFAFAGLVGLEDPLRDDTAATIAACHRAGVRVVMITGDHPTTAAAIAAQAGLRHAPVVTGAELEAMDAAALTAALAGTAVVARATPAHKLRIIGALRAGGEVVGMTGDGINDAPALKAADVGIAMGRGTDVAREAAGLVLLDDALAAIVPAIRIGRTIYDNLGKVASYLVAVHVPIAVLALVPPLLGWPVLLGPLHVVLLELVIDPTCSIVFEREPAEADALTRAPRRRGGHLFTPRRLAGALGLGAAACAGPLAAAGLAIAAGWSDGAVRTLGFVALIAAGLALVMATRGWGTRRAGRGRNRSVPWLFGLVGAVVGMVLAIPSLRATFGLAVPGVATVALATVAGLVPVAVVARAART
jgi:Ca2+-transporting ATPase